MNRIELLKKKIQDLYEARNPLRDEWADCLYESHIFVVADNAKRFAEQYHADQDLSVVAAMLHDIADSEMSRFERSHEKRSLEIATQLLRETEFSEKEIEVVCDAIRYHSCRDGESPHFLEGKVMATADAVAHLSTDFYDRFLRASMIAGRSIEATKEKILEKIDRDLRKKIFFEEVRAEVGADYERVRQLLVS